MTVPGSR